MNDLEQKCEICNGTGIVGRRTRFPHSIVGFGPVPEDAIGAYEDDCPSCRATGVRPRTCDDCEDRAAEEVWGDDASVHIQLNYYCERCADKRRDRYTESLMEG